MPRAGSTLLQNVGQKCVENTKTQNFDSPPPTINQNQQIETNEIEQVYSSGMLFTIRKKTSDSAVLQHVIIRDDYNINKLKLRDNPIIVDIGANIGTFSIKTGTVFNDGKIYAFEPEKDNYLILKKNIEDNKLNNVFAFNKAVSSKAEKCKLYAVGDDDINFTQGKNTGGYTLIPRNENTKVDTNQVVETISLDDIIKENKIDQIDYLKLDCEGSEFDILYSLPKEQFKKIKIISLEVHKRSRINQNPLALKIFLEEQGFVCQQHQDLTWELCIMYFIRRDV